MARAAQTSAGEDVPLVNLSEIAEIELFILKRMKEFTLGDHASMFKGSGFNFVGIRDWEPGDRVSSVEVKLGDRLRDRVEIIDGVSAGAPIVVSDVDHLADGMTVRSASRGRGQQGT